ncbi:hypothetical protein ACIKT0_10955 [Hansschlegelia beijingensis]|uniref:hypothetical protein n=1 Tax=Hansschlegelia beijingensis TaxID=1133344 RepID=UPI00387F1C03
MSYWIAFAIGAGFGFLQAVVGVIRKPLPMNHPVQGLSVAAVVGGLVYGTLIWLVARFVF